MVKVEYPKCIVKIKDNLKENNDQSVETKGLPKTKEKVSTTESGDGESPLDIKNIEKEDKK